MKNKIPFFIIAILLFGCNTSNSQDTPFKTKQAENQLWSNSEINIPLNSNQEIVLENGERLYSRESSKQIASNFNGWRIPTKEDVESLQAYFNNDADKIADFFKLHNHYGKDGEYQDRDRNVLGVFWTATEYFRNEDLKGYAFCVTKKDSTFIVGFDDFHIAEDNFYFSIRLVKDATPSLENN